MSDRRTDFARLLRLQRTIKSIREREHEAAKNRSASAEQSLAELSRMMSDAGPVVSLFPDLLANYFQKTLGEKSEADIEARETGDRLLREKKKLEQIEVRFGEQRAEADRKADDAVQSEVLDQRTSRGLSASSKIGKIS
jgi:hypothetical protein